MTDSLRSVYLSVALWHVGTALAMPVMSIWLKSGLGETSFFRLALYMAFPSIISIFGIFVISHLTDKYGHFRYAILLINIIGMIEYFLLSRISYAYQYLVIVGVGALVFPAYFSIIQAFATNICSPLDRGKVTGYISLSASIGWFFGSLLSGQIYEKLGINILLRISAIIFLLSGIVILRSKKFEGSILQNNSNVSIIGIIKRKQIFLILLTIFLTDFSGGAFFTLGSIYLYEKIKMQPELIGYSNAVATATGTLLLLKLGKYSDKHGRKLLYVIGLICYPVVFLLLTLFHNIWVVFILWSLPFYVFLRPTAPAMISDLTEENERSRGMSLVNLTSNISIAVGAMFGGIVTDIFKFIEIWTIFPAIIEWFAVFIGVFYVHETLNHRDDDLMCINN